MRSNAIRNLAVLLLLLLAAGAGADVPPLMNYQGVLTDLDGTPLNGNYELTFEIFSDPSPATDPLWAETHQNVDVVNGLFNVILGTVIAFEIETFTGDRYMAVTVDGGDQIVPYTQLTTVPYAARAAVADSLAGGNNGVWTVVGDNVHLALPGSVGLGTTDPQRKLQIGDASIPNAEGMIRLESRSGTQGSYRRWDVGVPETDGVSSGIGYSFIIDDINTGTEPELMVKYGSGNVGIGTIYPQEKLHVVGTIFTDGFQMQTDAGEGWVLTSDSAGLATWQPPGGSSGDGDWIISGGDMYAANSGDVGIGVTEPTSKLHVRGDGRVISAYSDGSRAGVYGKHMPTGNYGYFLEFRD